MEMTCQTTLTDVGQCYSTFWYSLSVARNSTKYITRTYYWRVFSRQFWPDHLTSIMHATVLTTRFQITTMRDKSDSCLSKRQKIRTELSWTSRSCDAGPTSISDTAGIFGLWSWSTNSVMTEGPWITGMCAAGTRFPSTSGTSEKGPGETIS